MYIHMYVYIYIYIYVYRTIRHKWFEKIDFEKLEALEIPAPFEPTVKDSGRGG